jgi:hypothetical protein
MRGMFSRRRGGRRRILGMSCVSHLKKKRKE